MSILKHIEEAYKKKIISCPELHNTRGLAELKNLTKNLQTHDFEIPICRGRVQDITEVKIYDQDSIGIKYISAIKDTIFPMHAHAGKELVAMAQGKIDLVMHAAREVYKKGDFILIGPEIAHEIKIIEDTVMLLMYTKMINGKPYEQH